MQQILDKAEKVQINNDEFIDILVKDFPEIKDGVLDEDDGLLTMQISCFKIFAQQASESNNTTNVNRCFHFVEKHINSVEDRIQNALYLSFLNKLSFEKNPKAEKLLSKKLADAKREITEYDEAVKTNIRVNRFLNDL